MTDQNITSPNDDSDTLTLSNQALIFDDTDSTHSKLRQLRVSGNASNASYSLGKLEQDLRMLHAKWQAVEADISDRDERIATMQTELAGMAAEKKASSNQLQELQDYVDARKSDWDKLNSRVQDYENTILGMGESLASHDEIVAGQEEDKAVLAMKAMELEREFAALRGRLAEKESSNAELQQALEDQSRELGSLNGDAIRLHKDIEKMRSKMEQRDATIESLRTELKERSKDSSTLEQLLSEEKSTIAELLLKMSVANRRIEELEPMMADLQSALRSSKATEQQLRDEAGERAVRTDELESQLRELLENHQNVEEELEAQRELVQMLERELGEKQENADFLDRSADRLSAISSGIRELDMQIDDVWLKPSTGSVVPLRAVFEHADEEMISPEELFDVGEAECEHLIVANDESSGEEVRFALNGREMTIGRSPHSDIRLRSKFVSRVHAKIRVEGSSAIIEDAGSMNGFLVNSVQTRRHTLKNGDKLEIGDSRLRYIHN